MKCLECDWLKSRELAAWLATQRPAASNTGWVGAMERRIFDWSRANKSVSFYTVDRYLVRLGLTQFDIPDECWTTRANQRGRRC